MAGRLGGSSCRFLCRFLLTMISPFFFFVCFPFSVINARYLIENVDIMDRELFWVNM